MRVLIEIERLVLDGLPVTTSEAPRVRAALESELARLFATGSLNRELGAGGGIARVDAPQISFGWREPPDAIGRGVARSVHAGIGRSE